MGLAFAGASTVAERVRLLEVFTALHERGVLKVPAAHALEIVLSARAVYTPEVAPKTHRGPQSKAEKRARTAPTLRPGTTTAPAAPRALSSEHEAELARIMQPLNAVRLLVQQERRELARRPREAPWPRRAHARRYSGIGERLLNQRSPIAVFYARQNSITLVGPQIWGCLRHRSW
jgi:hypothetical protein